jgi:hypothetical protein
MIVSELINKLKELPQEVEVVLYDNEYGTFESVEYPQMKNLVSYTPIIHSRVSGIIHEDTEELFNKYYHSYQEVSRRRVVVMNYNLILD